MLRLSALEAIYSHASATGAAQIPLFSRWPDAPQLRVVAGLGSRIVARWGGQPLSTGPRSKIRSPPGPSFNLESQFASHFPMVSRSSPHRANRHTSLVGPGCLKPGSLLLARVSMASRPARTNEYRGWASRLLHGSVAFVKGC